MPKGVMWRHEDLYYAGLGAGNPLGEPMVTVEALVANARARDPQIVQFPVPPLIHGAAQLGVLIAFNWGDKVVLTPRFDPAIVWSLVQEEGVNTMTIVGDAMARPLAEHLAASPGEYDVSSLVYAGSSGAVLSGSVKEQLRAALPNLFIGESFGSTETGYQGIEAQGVDSPPSGRRFFMDARTAVFDDGGRRVAPGSGAVGRLAMRGRIPLGYYKDEAKTAKTFVEAEGQRWVMPGDMATVDADGTVIVFGRGSVCINSGGEKIYPEEVEQALKSHPDVYDAVVVGVPDERWGERVTAVVQARPGRSLSIEEIGAHCRSRIAGYKVPRSLVLVDQILRHPSGKPDYPWAKRVALETLAKA
jgi:acyl-CoA synthetase (AMP-forming)/AMP-acid ligase II